MINDQVLCYRDPYDYWASRIGVSVRRSFYKGSVVGKVGAVSMALLDWWVPTLLRRVVNKQTYVHPITVAQLILAESKGVHDFPGEVDFTRDELVEILFDLSISGDDGSCSWGLSMPWMSKNGFYDEKIPFVTHTPYVMEALLALSADELFGQLANESFLNTWQFLEALKVMYETKTELAISYAPVVEPRIVINANSYGAYAYALHAVYGEKDNSQTAIEKLICILRWVIRQQKPDGCWFYYADSLDGNFIDCFHSCFVLKNLIKIERLLPETREITQDAIRSGWNFVQNNFVDSRRGLCRRFAVRDIKDPYVWDLYDQAEYLGLLIDFERYEEAVSFRKIVSDKFSDGSNWWARIDFIGRRWGKNFLRWGVVPFIYNSVRLDAVLSGECS